MMPVNLQILGLDPGGTPETVIVFDVAGIEEAHEIINRYMAMFPDRPIKVRMVDQYTLELRLT